MNPQEHSFPLPENEAHKLDEISGEKLEHSQEFSKLSEKFFTTNRIAGFFVVGMLGGLLALLWRRSA